MSTFAKSPRFQVSSKKSKTLRCQPRFSPQKATSDRNFRNKGEAGLREITVDNPANPVPEENRAGGTLQSEECNFGEGKAHNDYPVWIKEGKDRGESKENSSFGAEDPLKGIRGAEIGLMNQILEERFSLLEGLLENLRKEMDARRYA